MFSETFLSTVWNLMDVPTSFSIKAGFQTNQQDGREELTIRRES